MILLPQSVEHLNGVDAEFGDSASPTPNGKQYIRTMCTFRAYLWGTPQGYQDACVSRQCFTPRLTVGIAEGKCQCWVTDIKKPTGRSVDRKVYPSVGLLWVYPGAISQHNNGSGFRPIVLCLILIGSSYRVLQGFPGCDCIANTV